MGKLDDLFAMKFMLPEHRALLEEHEYVKTLVPKPIIDEQEFGEMNFRIYDSVQYDYAITVSYWRPVRGGLGVIESVFGTVQRIDAANRRIKIVNDWDFHWIDIERVVSVK
ncbi:YolD-like family protein [Brevibacillus sp. SYP-B805]|uniref:YolD-like family protein n=1 Tax=Brevibacillus sp. SYP-B805 TaxID=1578199 RepID=UPI0013EE03C0|nr:YolD-like family protein [Brevibacillus sp. SYP-B805]NGQ95520.1 YolD-like family protein [Brevibacillus sp. SYP-B805]